MQVTKYAYIYLPIRNFKNLELLPRLELCPRPSEKLTSLGKMGAQLWVPYCLNKYCRDVGLVSGGPYLSPMMASGSSLSGAVRLIVAEIVDVT